MLICSAMYSANQSININTNQNPHKATHGHKATHTHTGQEKPIPAPPQAKGSKPRVAKRRRLGGLS